jgi:RNA polymerase sigma factor (sigma-70 family)
MARPPLNNVLAHIRQLAAAGACSALSNEQLLDKFAACHDEAAFAELVERHGPMVLGVCRRVLGNLHDAEDACQAAFLVLARKFTSIRKGQSLGSWLHVVARHTALRLKEELVRKRAREGPTVDVPQPTRADEASWQDVLALLDEELQALPEKYRAVLVACYLESKTRDEAARELGLNLDIVRGRLERGRERLRARLVRRGLTFPAALLLVALADGTLHAALPSALASQTARAAGLYAAGSAASTSVISSTVAAVTEGVVSSMFLQGIKASVALLVVTALVCLSAGSLLWAPSAAGQPESPIKKAHDEYLAKPVAQPEMRREIAIDENQETAIQAKQPAEKTEKGKSLACKGQITDQATGKPIAGATVSVRWEAISSSGQVGQAQLSKYQTDADGKYNFVVPPEKMNLYVELQVAHPDFISRRYHKSFARDLPQNTLDTPLDPGEAITGTVRIPDGKPAVGIRVVAVSTKPAPKENVQLKFDNTPAEFYQGFAHTRTDAQGRFRLKATTPGRACFWILPDKYAISQHRLNDKERGDVGTFTLNPGVSLSGKVLDVKGKPLAGVNVNASHLEKPENFQLGLFRVSEGRSAVTNAKGEFTIEALAPGEYSVIPGTATLWAGTLRSLGPFVEEGEVGKTYPMPDFFVTKRVTLKEGVKPSDLEIRAVPSVVITLQILDRNGKPYNPRDFFHLLGEFDKTRSMHGLRRDGIGKWTARVPHGLENARVYLPSFTTTSYDYRLKKGDPLKNVRTGFDLGTVIEDLNIEIVDTVYPLPGKGAPKKDPKKN